MSSLNIENNTQQFDQKIFLFRLNLIDKDKLKIMVETFFMIFGEQYFGYAKVIEDKHIHIDEVKLEDKNGVSEIDDCNDKHINIDEVKLEDKNGVFEIDDCNGLKINDKEKKAEITSLKTSDTQQDDKKEIQTDLPEVNIYECNQCDKTFASRVSYKRHIKTEHSIQTDEKKMLSTIKCYFCEIKFDISKSKLGLITHLKDCHSDKDAMGVIEEIENNKTRNVCDICEKQFKNKHILATHIKTIHNELQKKKCDFCDLKFNTVKSNLRLITHLKNIHSNKDSHGIIKALEEEDTKIVCNICGKKLANKYSLASHIKLNHSNLEMAPCDICGKLIKQHEHIINYHMQSHNAYPCEYCPAVSRSKNYYKEHKAAHLSGSKQFKCDECHLQFDRKQYLNRHKQRIHSAKNNQHKKCDICGKMLSTRENLKHHVKAVHLQERPFFCDLCEYRTARKDNLTTHRKEKHGIQTKITKQEKNIFQTL